MEDELTFEMIGNDEDVIIEEDTLESENITEGNEDEPIEDPIENPEDPEGGGDDNQGKENPPEEGKESPNFYASIASSLKEDGILTLDDSDFKIETPEDFSALITKQVESQLDERIKRVEKALNAGASGSEVQEFENTLGYLDSLKEEDIKAETTEGEQLRFDLIYQDRLNRGFSQEKAKKEVERIFSTGTDIEEAIDAKEENSKYFKNAYDGYLEAKRIEQKAKLNEQKELSAKIEDKIKTSEEPITGIKLSPQERTKFAKQYSTIVAKSADNKPLTAIQKYAQDNPVDYQYNLNLLFYLTNGFKDMSKVVQKGTSQAKKTAVAELKQKLKIDNNGFNPSMGEEDIIDPESNSGWEISLD